MLRNFTGSSGVRAVIAVLMLLFVFACSASDSGIKKQRDDAIAAAAAAEEARLAAEAAAAAAAAEAAAKEEAARLAAEEAAAAAAEAARLAAEEAARQAEMDRLAKIDAATQAIAAATTAAEAQAAKDAVNDVATALEAVTLQAAVDARIAALETMASANAQRMALMTAAGAIDTSDLMTQQDVNAATMAIAALKMALTAATDVSDADKAMYQGQVDAAETAVAAAQSSLDHATQTADLTSAVMALQAIDLAELSTKEAIDAANTAIEEVRAALDAATELSASEKTAAMTELATADRTVMMAQGRFDIAAQKTALNDAVATLTALDLNSLMTQEQIDAADKAIIALDSALEAATNLPATDKLNATVDVTLAKRKVADAKKDLASNIGDQRMALTDAGTALREIDLEDLSDQAKIDAAQNAVNALKMALDDATHLSADDKAMYQTQLDRATETVRTAQTGMDRDGRMMAQRTAIMNAVTAARTAVGMVDDDATEAEVKKADDDVAALKAAIDGAEDLPEGDAEVAMAQGTLDTLEGQLASAKNSRTDAIAENTKDRNAEMAVTALRLYDGISAQMGDGDLTNLEANDRDAAYDTDGTAIEVSIGGETSPADAVITLTEDKDTTVAAHHGWQGQRFTDEPTGDGTYEAVVYSNVGEPMEGAKFNSGTGDGNVGFALVEGELPITDDTAVAARITSSRFDHSVGTKEFEKGENLQRVMIPGSYYGVSGTYYCTPGTGSTCAVQLADGGFNLGVTADTNNAFTAAPADTWAFKPTNPEARVMGTPDDTYASYGWWLHKSEDGKTYTASAFAADRGDVPDASDITALRGTATYMGGAAGKYALQSSIGGTNDAGHFTARAMLEADFNADMIKGTIDNFMGADGESRNWSVELKKSGVSDGGVILGADGTGDQMQTVWTLDGTAADPAGGWRGTLKDNGDDGVPEIATGTFHTKYGTAGQMVGAFGVNKQQ